MGVAAYNRGSRAISAQIDAEQPSPIQTFVRDLNAQACYPDAAIPFTTNEGLTMAQGHGGWWLTCNITGFGYWYKSPWTLMRCWAVRIVGIDETKREFHCIVDPSRKSQP